MKKVKIILYSLILTLFISYPAHAEKNYNFKLNPYNVDFNPFLLLFGIGISSYPNSLPQIEFKISDGYSVTPILHSSNTNSTIDDNKYSGAGSRYGIGLKMYNNLVFEQGEYYNFILSNSSADITNITKNETLALENISLALQHGKMWVWDSFNITFEYGASYNVIKVKKNTFSNLAFIEDAEGSACCHVELSLGYLF